MIIDKNFIRKFYLVTGLTDVKTEKETFSETQRQWSKKWAKILCKSHCPKIATMMIGTISLSSTSVLLVSERCVEYAIPTTSKNTIIKESRNTF